MKTTSRCRWCGRFYKAKCAKCETVKSPDPVSGQGKNKEMEMKTTQAQELQAQAQELQAQATALQGQVQKLVASEAQPPDWLLSLITVIADYFGITAEDFSARVQVVHPTPKDPVLLVDGRALVSWI